MKLFYEKNGQSVGPVDIQSIPPNELGRNTLVWTEGLDEWVKASEIESLESYLAVQPPPLPSRVSRFKEKIESKYDQDYDRETEATYFGALLLLVGILFALMSNDWEFGSEKDYRATRSAFGIISTIIRIGVVVYVRGIVGRQNRQKAGWSILAFFLPSIAMIIVGLLRKYRDPNEPAVEPKSEIRTPKTESREGNKGANMKGEDDDGSMLLIATVVLVIISFFVLFVMFAM